MVKCLECGAELKALGAHLKAKHTMGVEDYRDKYGADVDIGWTVNKSEPKVKDETEAEEFGNLTAAERTQYDQRYRVLYRQADEDPALESAIREVVVNEILVGRWQNEITSISYRIAKGKAKKEDYAALSALHKMVKETQELNLKQMTALNLTRAAKHATKKTVDTTPSKWANAIFKFAQNWTPEQVERNNQDMAEANVRLRHNLEGIKKLAVYSGTGEVSGDEEIKLEI